MWGSHPRNTGIIMYNGAIKSIHEIREGEYLLSEDGNPLKIKKIHKNNVKTYQIIPIDDTNPYIVGENHYLALKCIFNDTIKWNDEKNSWVAYWIENYTIQTKEFPVKKYDNDNINININDNINDNINNNINKKETRIPIRRGGFQTNIIKKLETDIYDKEKVYNHILLFLKNKRAEQSYIPYGEVIRICVKDYIKMTNKWKEIFVTYRTTIDHVLNDSTTIQPPHPYVFGYWLGDDQSSFSTFTFNNDDLNDVKIRDYIIEKLSEQNLTLHLAKKNLYKIIPKNHSRENIFIKFIEKNALINEKSIPTYYKSNSIEIRKQLLAGFLDANATIESKSQQYTIYIKSSRLVKNLMYLIRSLGFSATKWNLINISRKTRLGTFIGNYYVLKVYNILNELPMLNTSKIFPLTAQNTLHPHNLHYNFRLIPNKLEFCYGFEIADENDNDNENENDNTDPNNQNNIEKTNIKMIDGILVIDNYNKNENKNENDNENENENENDNNDNEKNNKFLCPRYLLEDLTVNHVYVNI
jgi:hypothetical protein